MERLYLHIFSPSYFPPLKPLPHRVLYYVTPLLKRLLLLAWTLACKDVCFIGMVPGTLEECFSLGAWGGEGMLEGRQPETQEVAPDPSR